MYIHKNTQLWPPLSIVRIHDARVDFSSLVSDFFFVLFLILAGDRAVAQSLRWIKCCASAHALKPPSASRLSSFRHDRMGPSAGTSRLDVHASMCVCIDNCDSEYLPAAATSKLNRLFSSLCSVLFCVSDEATRVIKTSR